MCKSSLHSVSILCLPNFEECYNVVCNNKWDTAIVTAIKVMSDSLFKCEYVPKYQFCAIIMRADIQKIKCNQLKLQITEEDLSV